MVRWSVTQIPIGIVHTDERIVVVSKAPGVPSQPDPSGDPSALELAAERVGGRLFPVHRIDRPASGLLLFARTASAAAELSALFRCGAVQRRYWAIVAGRVEPTAGSLQNPLNHDRSRNRSVIRPGGKPASLTYEVRAIGQRYTLLEITLQTGRHHQIRAQLAHAGWPIRGDLKYGARRSLPGGGISLHAVSLLLPDSYPGRPLSFSATPPEDTLWHELTVTLFDE